mgnify:CR=1 FL=1
MIDVEKKRVFIVYFRFLYILIPSMSCMYVNPCSKRSVACFIVMAVLHVYSSSSLNGISCVYRSVCLRSLCPNCCLTNKRSLVLW